jgi:hypothetical protein
MILPCWGCSSDPVPYTDSLGKGRSCYVDVVEITPISGSTWNVELICQCVLADGSTALMKIDPEDYVTYFDSSIDEYNLEIDAKKITFKEPVRLNGVADRDKVTLDPYSTDETREKLFYFESSDTFQTLNKGERSFPQVTYSPGMKPYMGVSMEILSLTIEVELSLPTTFGTSHYLCKALTASGEEQWILVDKYKYGDYFSSMPALATPVKIIGKTTVTADEIQETAIPAGVPDVIFSFWTVDPDQFESGFLSNQPPIPYEEAQEIGRPVYLDVTELIPVGSFGEYVYAYYKAVLANGETVWMRVHENEYISVFNKNAESVKKNHGIQQITYAKPVRMIGSLQEDELMTDDRTEEKTSVKLFHFKQIDFTVDNMAQIVGNAVKSNYGKPFEADMRNHVLVYAEILSAVKMYRVSAIFSDEAYMMKADTADGGEIWMLISVEDYDKLFGAAVEFTEPVAVYGTSVYRDEEVRNADEFPEIQPLLFLFNGLVSPNFEAKKASRLPREAYTEEAKLSQRVFLDITEITPEYTVTIPSEYVDTVNYVCRAQTADGKTVWIYMGESGISIHFSPKYDGTTTFDEPLRINGYVTAAEEVASNLSEAIGQDRLIVLE